MAPPSLAVIGGVAGCSTRGNFKVRQIAVPPNVYAPLLCAAAGPETIKNGHKNMAQQVECSPLKYSEMGSTVGRTIGSPAFLTKDGVRTGAKVSILDATARVHNYTVHELLPLCMSCFHCA